MQETKDRLKATMKDIIKALGSDNKAYASATSDYGVRRLTYT
jgi:hypothetical protein